MIDYDIWLTSGSGGPDDNRPDCEHCNDSGCDYCEPPELENGAKGANP